MGPVLLDFQISSFLSGPEVLESRKSHSFLPSFITCEFESPPPAPATLHRLICNPDCGNSTSQGAFPLMWINGKVIRPPVSAECREQVRVKQTARLNGITFGSSYLRAISAVSGLLPWSIGSHVLSSLSVNFSGELCLSLMHSTQANTGNPRAKLQCSCAVWLRLTQSTQSPNAS